MFITKIKQKIYFGFSILNSLSSQKSIHKTIRLNVPYHAADPGNCGLACLWMVLSYAGQKIPSISKLETKYIHSSKYYLDPTGWLHSGLVSIAGDYGLDLRAKKFGTTTFVIKQIKHNHPVIVSILVPPPSQIKNQGLYFPDSTMADLEGHLVVVVGVSEKNIFIHDPRNQGDYSSYLSLPIYRFNQIYTGRCLYVTT